ncbi:Gamma-aminobutyric acid receptor exp-1 [Frankliniella fusca]|uniref:Gamma-aminobutyric acid receptor exp-1 n=1 Tax=Frankliniella fusca TaxID=407009 RepID=A0AAE1HD31_9NEOP|nr:Gamma-aminobutyric acid receptor exp-1 [Frankliniella fusca]
MEVGGVDDTGSVYCRLYCAASRKDSKHQQVNLYERRVLYVVRRAAARLRVKKVKRCRKKRPRKIVVIVKLKGKVVFSINETHTTEDESLTGLLRSRAEGGDGAHVDVLVEEDEEGAAGGAAVYRTAAEPYLMRVRADSNHNPECRQPEQEAEPNVQSTEPTE